MFFRRERPEVVTFGERLKSLESAGFVVRPQADKSARLIRGQCAADVEDAPGGVARIGRAGVLIGDEIGLLVDGGFQKFFQTPSGKRLPALASHLKALHDFEEDVWEALGLTSLYNQSLGTTCDYHVYDRLVGRD